MKVMIFAVLSPGVAAVNGQSLSHASQQSGTQSNWMAGGG